MHTLKKLALWLLMIALPVVLLACSGSATIEPAASTPTRQPVAVQPTTLPQPEASTPTMATCQAWIRAQHTLDYPNHGCQEHAEILNSVAGNGGGAIPLQDSKFFIAWERE